MSPVEQAGEPRLLVIGDLDRLGPIVRKCFAPLPIIGVRGYLTGVAEIRQSPTRAVLVGFEDGCRKIESAISAMKAAAGEAPVVICCDPVHEPVCRRLLSGGADDYLIFPPSPAELERALGLPSRETRRRWLESEEAPSAPSAEELAQLAEVLPRVAAGDRGTLDAVAALICAALQAESASVVLEGRTGRSGAGREEQFDAVLVAPITEGRERIGQIRVGRSRIGGFTIQDTVKLQHYAVLFGRMAAGARCAEQWRRMAMTDDLTGLANRRRLFEFLEEKTALAMKARSTVTVLYFDIDDFKRYNDAYGHDAGDEILRDIGVLFVKCSRESDLVARYGGDEFVVVFWDPGGPRTLGSRHPEVILDVVKRFREALRKHTFSRLGPEATGCLTISGGIAHFPWDARSAQELIETADRALLHAKAAGKNRFWVIGDDDVVR